jgi:hypothetical protein
MSTFFTWDARICSQVEEVVDKLDVAVSTGVEERSISLVVLDIDLIEQELVVETFESTIVVLCCQNKHFVYVNHCLRF